MARKQDSDLRRGSVEQQGQALTGMAQTIKVPLD